MSVKTATSTLESHVQNAVSNRLDHTAYFDTKVKACEPVRQAAYHLMYRREASQRAIAATVAALNSVQ